MILFKKLWRTISKYKAQFISMILMVGLGLGVFLGFNMEWHSIQSNVDNFFTDNNFANYRVYTDNTFSESDINNMKNIDDIDDATRWLSFEVSVTDKGSKISLVCVEDYGISSFTLIDGTAYNKTSNGIWLSDKYAENKKLTIGDTISITYSTTTYNDIEIVGLIKSPEYLVCVASENQLMPDYSLYGYGYVSPALMQTMTTDFGFSSIPYNQIAISSSLSKSDIESQIKNVFAKTLQITSLEENYGYSSAQGEVEEGQTMCSILPVLFLLIAMLTMITTMHRIVKSEKTQIGTLKALGFKDKQAVLHYSWFGIIIGVLGAVIGLGLGYLIAFIIINPNGMMGTYLDMPTWNLTMSWYSPLIILGTLALLYLVGILAVKNMIKGSVFQNLKPYTPKKQKHTHLEKTKLWKKLSFSTKWNYRDVIRNKTRSIVTLIGVLGCVVLVIAGLGMRDTMNSFMNRLDADTMNYNIKATLTTTITEDEALNLQNEYNGDLLSQSSISLNGETYVMEVYNMVNDTVHFLDKNNNKMTLENDGVYICLRIADTGIKIGDTITISPYGSELTYNVSVAGINRSMTTETITMSADYAKNNGIVFNYNYLLTNESEENLANNNIVSTQSKQELMDSYNSFMDIMNTMVLILIVAAVFLGIIVLYNLGVMGYLERYREFATLKVVGFKDKKISKLLISQNLWITVVGFILGVPLGIGILNYLIVALAGEYEMQMTISFVSILISFVLIAGVSLLVSLMVSKKNKKIDMVEALKSTD